MASGSPGLCLPSPVTLLSTCGAFPWDSAEFGSPLGPPVATLLQYEGSGQDQVLQDSSQLRPSHRLSRTKRHRQLVRTQPHLVHHVAAPEVEESSVRQGAARTREEENAQVEEEVEVRINTRAGSGFTTAQGPVQLWSWQDPSPRCCCWFWKSRSSPGGSCSSGVLLRPFWGLSGALLGPGSNKMY